MQGVSEGSKKLIDCVDTGHTMTLNNGSQRKEKNKRFRQ